MIGAAPTVTGPALAGVPPAPDVPLFRAIERLKELAASEQLGEHLRRTLTDEIQATDQSLAPALGLAEEDVSVAGMDVRSLALDVATSLGARTQERFRGWGEEQPNYPTTAPQRHLVDVGLRIAVFARGATSVKTKAVLMPGGLRLPEELLAILVLMQHELARERADS